MQPKEKKETGLHAKSEKVTDNYLGSKTTNQKENERNKRRELNWDPVQGIQKIESAHLLFCWLFYRRGPKYHFKIKKMKRFIILEELENYDEDT